MTKHEYNAILIEIISLASLYAGVELTINSLVKDKSLVSEQDIERIFTRQLQSLDQKLAFILEPLAKKDRRKILEIFESRRKLEPSVVEPFLKYE